MSLVERLRKQAALHEAAIWSDGYRLEQEEMRFLLTEAADALELKNDTQQSKEAFADTRKIEKVAAL